MTIVAHGFGISPGAGTIWVPTPRPAGQQLFAAEFGYEILADNGSTWILRGIIDPSSVGLDAPASSIYLRDGLVSDEIGMYQKVGPATTNWRRLTTNIEYSTVPDVDVETVIDYVIASIHMVTWKIRAVRGSQVYGVTIESLRNGTQMDNLEYGIITLGNPPPDFVTFSVRHNVSNNTMELVVVPGLPDVQITLLKMNTSY